MEETVIRAENLGKLYFFEQKAKFSDYFKKLFKFYSDSKNPLKSLWALKEVSFEVKKGQIVGIIGPNGAGKTTLLKIFSRITSPTEGRVFIKGQVNSLLETGIGFHPELTGRENIYFQASLLGLKKRETNQKLDEIMAFSELNRFIDIPIKFYSAGMFARLAFSIAATLEPDILFIDEILAVGDIAFQKKSLSKIREIINSGRTVLLVSHNLMQIENLADTVIYLNKGKIKFQGTPKEAVLAYLNTLERKGKIHKVGLGSFDLKDASRGGKIESAKIRALASLEICDSAGNRRDIIACGEDLIFEIGYELEKLENNLSFEILISSDIHGPLAFVENRFEDNTFKILPLKGKVACKIHKLPFAPGVYKISLGLKSDQEGLDWIEEQIELNVEAADFFGTGHLPKESFGPFLLKGDWEIIS